MSPDMDDVDTRSVLHDEAALAVAAELTDLLRPAGYVLVPNVQDCHGTIGPSGIQVRPGATIGAARFVVRNRIGELFTVRVDRRDERGV